MKGEIFFHFRNFKKGFSLKKNLKKIKAVLRKTKFKEFPRKLEFFLDFFLRKPLFKISKIKKKLLLSLLYFPQNEKKNSFK